MNYGDDNHDNDDEDAADLWDEHDSSVEGSSLPFSSNCKNVKICNSIFFFKLDNKK